MKQGRLAAGIRPEKRNPFAAIYRQVHIYEHAVPGRPTGQLFVAGMEVLDAEGTGFSVHGERIPTDFMATQLDTRMTAHVKNKNNSNKGAPIRNAPGSAAA